jgi:hypothetical protein
MKARVVQAWVNMIPRWRVYYNQELLATFDTEYSARLCADYLNENY